MTYNTIKIILLVLFFVQRCVENVQLRKAQCGVSQIKTRNMIRHGANTTQGEWPWHAAVYHRNGRKTEYACGGTLISEQFVLTAAHCTIAKNKYQITNRNIFIKLGVHNLDDLSRVEQQHQVAKIHTHDDYKSDSVQNDITILELVTTVEFNKYVQPACLSLVENLTGQNGTVIGWGMTESDDYSSDLKSACLPVIDFNACLESDRATFGETLSKGILCAGYTNGTTVCNGDSGSGLFFKENNAWFLGGIVSYMGIRSVETRLCSTDGYGAFTKIHTYLPWIMSITELQLKDDVCEVKDIDPGKNYSNLLPSYCGCTAPSENSNDDNFADLFEYPWMAILRLNGSRSGCEGTLINNRYVLTAAQCVEQDNLDIRVILGEYNVPQAEDCGEWSGFKECAPPVQEYGVECVLRHQNYSSSTKLNDIALLRLAKEVTFADHVQPICLPMTDTLKQLNATQYIMSSWADRGKILLETSMRQVNTSVCQILFRNGDVQLQESHHCARRLNNLFECFWNSGAPLGMRATNRRIRFIQFGIVSFRATCVGWYPFMYTKVSDHMEWIVANIRP